MLESLKYAVECAWYIFLFIPLFVAVVVTVCLGVAGVYAIFCNCVVPATNNMRKNIHYTKLELEKKE